GRAGYDDRGYVVAQAPEHDVENARLVARAGDDPKKLKKIQRKKAPDGFVSWGEPTFERLIGAQPEPLRSHFRVSTAMVVDVIARPGPCFPAMRHLLEDNHEPRVRQRRHILRAIDIYRGLRTAGLVELTDPDETGATVRLTTELPPDFALSNPLSSFAIAALELLDVDDPDYARDALSVVESIVEDPRPVLRAQRDLARGAAVAQMKADGLDYEERVERVEEITWPRPLADLVEGAFEIYLRGHPWVGGTPPSPKSVVREMLEHADGFGDVVARLKIARSEGVLLRYLTDVYRIARHGVPPDRHTEEFDDIVSWLGQVVRGTDSSLIDEWEQLTSADPTSPTAVPPSPPGPDRRAWRVHIRNQMFALVTAFAREDEDTLRRLHPDVDWPAALDDYFDEYDDLGTAGDARSPRLFSLDESTTPWTVRQTLADPAGDHGWAFVGHVEAPPADEPDAMPRVVDLEVVEG
ncbi:DUF3516 domain-containing protein, partial [Williamsia deligens]